MKRIFLLFASLIVFFALLPSIQRAQAAYTCYKCSGTSCIAKSCTQPDQDTCTSDADCQPAPTSGGGGGEFPSPTDRIVPSPTVTPIPVGTIIARAVYMDLTDTSCDAIIYFLINRMITFNTIVNTTDTKIEVASGK